MCVCIFTPKVIQVLQLGLLSSSFKYIDSISLFVIWLSDDDDDDDDDDQMGYLCVVAVSFVF